MEWNRIIIFGMLFNRHVGERGVGISGGQKQVRLLMILLYNSVLLLLVVYYEIQELLYWMNQLRKYLNNDL